MLERALAWLFPERIACLMCRDEWEMDGTDDLCGNCRAGLPYVLEPYCAHCGRPFADGRTHVMCADCRKKDDHAVDQARAAFLYRGPVIRMIRGLKFRGATYWARFLAGELLPVLESAGWPRIDALVPVPLHGLRGFRRGFNQSALIACRLSELTGIPMRAGWLRRTRYTRAQRKLSAAARRTNLVGAFWAAEAARDANVVLIDDVYTTGETAFRCALALRAAGCARVYVLAAATTAAEHGGLESE